MIIFLLLVNLVVSGYSVYLLREALKGISAKESTQITSIWSTNATDNQEAQFIEPNEFEEKIKKSKDLDNLIG